MNVQEDQPLARCLGDRPLPLGELAEEVDEHVGHRDVGQGEPYAARVALEEA